MADPAAKPTPAPEIDQDPANTPAGGAWKPPVGRRGWSEVPLKPGGEPQWGDPGQKWDPKDPDTDNPHGRTITYNPMTRVLRIHCGGGFYEIAWNALCNDKKPKEGGKKPGDQCTMGDPDDTFITVTPTKHLYIRDSQCSVQVTCVIEYQISTQAVNCAPGDTHRQWKPVGAPVVTNQYSLRSTIFQCC